MLFLFRLQPGLWLGLLLLICCAGPAATSNPSSSGFEPTARGAERDTLAQTQTSADDAVGAAHATKRALLVGVSKYADPGHDELHTESDVLVIREALTRHGFTDFEVLQNQQATYANIKAAFERLVARSVAGDVVVFHFSGHGVQITDGIHDTNPGDEPDGYDEALVPHDAPSFGQDNLDNSVANLKQKLQDVRHLRDDEIHTFLEALRRKLGPTGNVAVWFDACYSGTGARLVFEPVSRGQNPIGRPATFHPTTLEGERGLFETRNTDDDADDALKASLVVFSSSRHDKKSFEMDLPDGRKGGRLSHALHAVLQTAGPTTTYQALFDRMQVWMANVGGNVQTPQLEGAAQNLVFSGQAIATQPHFEIKAVDTDREVRLKGGTLLGLSAGTEVAFYPIGTHNPDASLPPIARGRVAAHSDAGDDLLSATAKVQLDQPADIQALQNSWAFVTVQGASGLRLDVRLDASLTPAERRVLMMEMENLTFVKFIESAHDPFDLQIGKEAEGVFLQVPRAPARLGKVVPLDANTGTVTTAVARGVALRVLDYGRQLHLKRIAYTQHNTGVNVKLSILPPTEAPPNLCNYTPDQLETRREGGVWTLDQNDGFLLRLHNEGGRQVFFTVLGLWPDGGIYPLYPRGAESNLAEARIKEGTQMLLPECYHVDGPATGALVIKVFASKVQIDFSPILTGGTKSIDGDLPDLMSLLETGGKTVAVEKNLHQDLNTHAVTLTITE